MEVPATPAKKSFEQKGSKTPSIINAFLILTTTRNDVDVDKKPIKTSCKVIWKCSQDEKEEDPLDENSIVLMSLPDGVDCLFDDQDCDQPRQQFHSFLITRENGNRFFGSSLLCPKKDAKTGFIVVESYCLISSTPFVVSTEKLLHYFYSLDPQCSLIQRICRLKLPAKGKCLKLLLPPIPKSDSNVKSLGNVSPIDKSLYIFRGTSEFPLLDHPLRKLFMDVLNPQNFILALGAALLEFQVLVISNSYQEMMLVSESLTSLLLPFQWQHVYVPILPSILGLHYLDAPTPYIMGINARVFSTACSSFPSLTTHTSQLRIFCGENRIEFIPGSDFDVDFFMDGTSLSGILPPFMKQLTEDVDAMLKSNIKLLTQESRILSKSLAMERVTQVARKHHVLDPNFDYLDDLKLNHTLRVLFTAAFEENLLKNCDKFIVSSQAENTNNSAAARVKFDVVSFLSDQPDAQIPFFKKFLDTQMFASLIDSRFRKNNIKRPPFMNTRIAEFSMENLQLLKDSVDKMFDGAFEDATVVDLNETDISKSCLSPRRQRKVYKNLHTTVNNNKDGFDSVDSVKTTIVMATSSETTNTLSAQSNSRTVETLLRDTRVKTKRILLEKMSHEETSDLGISSSCEGVEGNALIASLCDLVERVWNHGRKNEVYNGSSFWYDLTAYCRDIIQGKERSTVENLTSTLNHLTTDHRGSYSLISSSRSTPSSPMKSRSLGSRSIYPPSLTDQTVPSLIHDILSVQRMTDVRTDIGKSRAFIRLCLEKKVLSEHLRQLLDHQDMSNSYDNFAFLRCEEEKEQFLTHLLTLNAVDLLCFTNSFVTSFLSKCFSKYKWANLIFLFSDYRVFAFGSGPFSGFLTLSGTNGNSGQVPMDLQGSSFVFTTKNLGLLKFLSLSCSFTTKIYLDFVIIRNEETGRASKFPCSHWFGRNSEDSMERILVAYDVHDYQQITDLIKKSQNKTSSIGRHFSRNLNLYEHRKDLSIEKLQLYLKERVDDVVKCCYKDQSNFEDDETLEIIMDSSGVACGINSKNNGVNNQCNKSTLNGDKRRKSCSNVKCHYQHLNHLLFSEPDGIISLLKECLYIGFKNHSKSPFRKQVFLWDYILRIQMELKLSWKTLDSHLSSVKSDPSVTPSRRKVASKTDRKFIDIVDNINSMAVFWGKDGKLCLLLTIALRDKLLAPHFVRLLSWPSLAKQFYEPVSFVTDQSLITFLIQVMSKTNTIDLSIDSVVTKGL
jgi:hypothetical protein